MDMTVIWEATYYIVMKVYFSKSENIFFMDINFILNF